MSISYILAGYNEEKMIASSIETCLSILSRDFLDYELILVDDASTDSTGRIMDEFAGRHERIMVLHNLVNLNFGTSILRGLKAATKEFVIYNAADLPLSPDLTKAIVEEMQKYDVLVLERTSYSAVGWRKITSSMNSILLHILYPSLMRGTPITNFVQCFRRETLQHVIPFARSPIFVWPEMIFRAKLKGLRVGNRPTEVHIPQVRAGAFGKPHDIIWGIYDMLRFRVRCWGKSI